MPDRWAIATGNWSSTATWNNGAVLGIPTGSDDVFISGSGFTVTIDQDVNVLSLNTIATGSIAAGGNFSVTGSRNIRANVIRAGTATCLNISGTSTTVNITGSVSGSNSTNISTVNITTVSNSINISSSFLLGGLAGSGNSPAINAAGTLNTITVISPAITAGANISNNAGIFLAGDRNTLVVTGSVSGSSVVNNAQVNGITVSTNNPYNFFMSGSAIGRGTNGPAINLNSGTGGTGVGNVSFIGNIIGAAATTVVAMNNVTASITSSLNGGSGVLLNIGSTSLVLISGSITGGTGATAVTVTGNSNTLNVTGSCTGGTGTSVFGLQIGGSFNQVSILGDAIGGASPSIGQSPGVVFGGSFNNYIIRGNLIGANSSTNLGAGLYINGSFHTCSIFGDVVPGRFGGGLDIRSLNASTINLFGNVRSSASGGGNIASVHFLASAVDRVTLNISGSILPGESGAGTAGSNNFGIRFETTVTNTTINISGSVFAGGTGSFTQGINMNSVSALSFNTINILGNLVAGPTGSSTNNFGIGGIPANTTINVLGSAIAGSAAAISNTSNSTSITVGTAVASVTASAISNTGNIPVIYEAATFATNGTIPISGPARLRLNDNNFFSCSLDTGGYKTLINVNNISNGLPAASDIRRGIIYNFGDGIGTMAVPSASYVDSGVAVGNTVGTAVYTTASLATTMWNTNVAALTGSNSVGERLRNISTVSSTGDQLVALL